MANLMGDGVRVTVDRLVADPRGTGLQLVSEVVALVAPELAAAAALEQQLEYQMDFDRDDSSRGRYLTFLD